MRSVGRTHTGVATGDRCVGRTGQVTCGVVGFGVALVGLAVAYSAVVALVSAVPLLSTTAIVFVGTLFWLSTWLVLVLALQFVQGRIAIPVSR